MYTNLEVVGLVIVKIQRLLFVQLEGLRGRRGTEGPHSGPICGRTPSPPHPPLSHPYLCPSLPPFPHSRSEGDYPLLRVNGHHKMPNKIVCSSPNTEQVKGSNAPHNTPISAPKSSLHMHCHPSLPTTTHDHPSPPLTTPHHSRFPPGLPQRSITHEDSVLQL